MQPSRATACTIALLVTAAAPAAACNSILGNENASVVLGTADAAAPVDAGPPDSPTPFDAAAQAEAEAGNAAMTGDAAACPSGKGPAMVNVADLFCIDGTEVTIAQYNQFLTAGLNPGTLGEPMPACGFNKSFAPGGPAYDPGLPITYPVTGVNWCEAFAFCAWSGKRLCGAMGGGGPVTSATFATLQNEHYYACSAGGARMYPYGVTYSSTACNGNKPNNPGALPAGALTTCEGGFTGLFDMVGNVEEWQNGCVGGGTSMDMCLHGTGSFDYGTPACGYVDQNPRDYQFDDVGIRCCANLL
jgi:formylglycine-generating enzyme required for sulfatase activity